jgi:hypothetical protein
MVQRKRNVQRTRGVTIFLGLTIVYAMLVVIAKQVESDNTFIQTLLLSLSAAILGSGIAFFLIEVGGLQQARNKLVSIVGVFTALALVFVVLVLIALLLFASNVFVYTLLLTMGAAIFAGSLTFFLIELVSLRQANG